MPVQTYQNPSFSLCHRNTILFVDCMEVDTEMYGRESCWYPAGITSRKGRLRGQTNSEVPLPTVGGTIIFWDSLFSGHSSFLSLFSGRSFLFVPCRSAVLCKGSLFSGHSFLFVPCFQVIVSFFSFPFQVVVSFLSPVGMLFCVGANVLGGYNY